MDRPPAAAVAAGGGGTGADARCGGNYGGDGGCGGDGRWALGERLAPRSSLPAATAAATAVDLPAAALCHYSGAQAAPRLAQTLNHFLASCPAAGAAALAAAALQLELQH